MTALIPLAGAAIGAIGSAFGNQPGKQETSSTPWAPQGTALTGLYDTAQGVYDTRAAAGPYEGATYAGLNGIQDATATSAANWTQGQGAGLANGTGVTAGTLQSAATPYVQNADAIASTGTGPANAANMGVLSGYANGTTTLGHGIDPTLSSTLNTAAINGANNLGRFTDGLATNATAATTDRTNQTVADAGLYANGGYSKQLMDATNADIRNTLGETTAGLNRQASMSGDLNSSRAGMAEGMANRDAARQIALSDATIGSHAYDLGVKTASEQGTSGLSLSNQANIAGLQGSGALATGIAGQQSDVSKFDTTSRLGAANTALTQDLGANSLDATTKLSANNQLGAATSAGVGAATAAEGLAATNSSLGQAAGGVYQNDQNAGLGDEYAQWQRQNGYGQSILSPYAQIIEQGYNGAPSSSSTKTEPQNMVGNILGGAAGAQGLYKTFTSTP